MRGVKVVYQAEMLSFAEITARYKQMGERSRKSIVHILLSFGAKGISIATQLLIVPLTIHYVNPTQYGIWLTLASIIGWISFFDLGFGNGMRNKVAEAQAKGDVELARQYVSTTYVSVGVIVAFLFLLVEGLNLFLDWASVLHVDGSDSGDLRKVFAVLTAFFCLDMVVKLFKSLLSADQKPGLAAWIDVLGQLISLGVIYLLTRCTSGSLLHLATYYSGIPALTVLVVSVLAFRLTSYRRFSPRLRSVRKALVKDILNVGIQFFVIYICMLLIFQVINLVISRELGPDAVTEYNIAYKYFNIAFSVMLIILTPFWSAFTDAYHKKDYAWMRKAKRALEGIWVLELAAVALMILIAPWFYRIWIGDSVAVSPLLSVGMAVYILMLSLGNVYMSLINGIGTIRIQLIIYVFFALISWPLMQYSCRAFGLMGVLIAPTLVNAVLALFGKLQIEKLLSGKCSGLWGK